MQNALALFHSGQVHLTEPKSYSSLKVRVAGVLEDQHQNSLFFKTKTG